MELIVKVISTGLDWIGTFPCRQKIYRTDSIIVNVPGIVCNVTPLKNTFHK